MAAATQRQFLPMPAALSSRAARLEPFDWYREMRTEAPVRYDDDRQVWDVFRYDDTKQVLSDTESFSSDVSKADVFEFPDEDLFRPLQRSILRSDPPRHTWLRDVVDDRFQPGAIGALAPHVREVADELLDERLADGEMDVIEDLAYPLPVVVIAELLGVPADDRDRFREWSNVVIATPDSDDPAAFEEFQERQNE